MKQEVVAELERICLEHGGVLNPQDVVETARNPDNILHDQFCWDDTKAAHEYRLHQARRIIRVVTEVVESTKSEVRAYVSLESYRKADGGYLPMQTVMANEKLTSLLLEQARKDMRIFESKYSHLKEVAEVISVMKRAIA
jgi:hypothetical protein